MAARDLAGSALQFRGTLALETPAVENSRELGVGLAALGGADPEMAAALLFKKPVRLSSAVELMVGVGPELVRGLGGTHRGPLRGTAAVSDFMVWPSRDVGWSLEPGYEVIFRHGASH